MKTYLSVITFLVFLISLSSVSFGTVIHVPDDYGTIQSAIDNADPGDTIIVVRGTYTGAGNKNLDFGGLAITVKGEGCREETIIDCNGSGRGFHFQSGEGSDSVVENLTIQEGVSSFGAGIYCHNNSNPTINNCIITGCSGGMMVATEAAYAVSIAVPLSVTARSTRIMSTAAEASIVRTAARILRTASLLIIALLR